MSKFYWCCCLYLKKDFHELKETSENILTICKVNNLANWGGVTNIIFSLISGDSRKAEDNLLSLLNVGATQMQGFWNSIISEVEINNGEYLKAKTRLEISIDQSVDVEDYFFVKLQKEIINNLNSKMEYIRN